MSELLRHQGKMMMRALETQFSIRASEIQRISTGDLPVEKADKLLIRNLAQYQAIKNGLRVSEMLDKSNQT